MENAEQLLKILAENQVEFVIVGGIAGIFHGSPLTTLDLDVCAPLSVENMMRISTALRPLHARHRMNPNAPALS